jgi:hypothetical protein
MGAVFTRGSRKQWDTKRRNQNKWMWHPHVHHTNSCLKYNITVETYKRILGQSFSLVCSAQCACRMHLNKITQQEAVDSGGFSMFL